MAHYFNKKLNELLAKEGFENRLEHDRLESLAMGE